MKTTEMKLIDTGIALFQQNGYENTSVLQICEACHVTKGSFYHHFKSKRDILEKFYDSLFHDPTDLMLSIAKTQTYKEKLWKVLEYGINSTISLGPEMLYMMMKDNIIKDLVIVDDSKKGIDKTEELILNYIALAQEHQEVKNPNTPADIWFSYQSGLYGIALHWSANKGSYDEKEQLLKLFHIIFY